MPNSISDWFVGDIYFENRQRMIHLHFRKHTPQRSIQKVRHKRDRNKTKSKNYRFHFIKCYSLAIPLLVYCLVNSFSLYFQSTLSFNGPNRLSSAFNRTEVSETFNKQINYLHWISLCLSLFLSIQNMMCSLPCATSMIIKL